MVFWGQILNEPDKCQFAAHIPSGDLDLVALDGTWRMNDWHPCKHWVYIDSGTRIPAGVGDPVCEGAPGYNTRGNGRVLGNWAGSGVDPLSLGYGGHTHPGVGSKWPDGEAVELLAINHWREEQAYPIRLLYPADLGPPPAGNEGSVRVRLPAAQADGVVRALLGACNQ